MRLDFTALAEQDLETIADYIAADNPTRALSFVRGLRVLCPSRSVRTPGNEHPPAQHEIRRVVI